MGRWNALPHQNVAFSVRKSHINNQRIDAAGDQTQLVQSLGCRPRRINLYAALLQILCRKHLNEGFVLHHEDTCGGRLGIDDIAEFFAQGGLSKGLGQQFDAGIEPTIMHDRIPRIPRREQNLDGGAKLASFFAKLPTVHPARQPNIGEDNRDFGMAFQHLESRAGISRL